MTGVPLRSGGPSVYGLGPDTDIGGELYERELVRRLPEYGVNVLIGLPPGAGLEPTPGVRAVAMRRPSPHWTLAPFVFTPWTVTRLRRGEIDILRAPSVRYTGPALLAARALSRSHVPVAIHHHHFERRWHRLEAAILRRADLVLTVSEHSRRELIAAGVSAQRIRVAYNGIASPETVAPEPAASWPGDGLRLLYMGRLEARKRPQLAIDTLAGLNQAGQRATLLLAGAGDEHAALRARARSLGIEDRVGFLGRVSESRKWGLYEGADILLFGSTLEGFGLVVAEAQSRGLPVVAARGTATSEAMDDGASGRLVSPTADAFAQAVTEMADPRLRAEMGRCGVAHAARFTWPACAAAVADAFREATR